MTRVLLAATLAGTVAGVVIGHQLAAWAWATVSGEGR